jgi:hypothetical protein
MTPGRQEQRKEKPIGITPGRAFTYYWFLSAGPEGRPYS